MKNHREIFRRVLPRNTAVFTLRSYSWVVGYDRYYAIDEEDIALYEEVQMNFVKICKGN